MTTQKEEVVDNNSASLSPVSTHRFRMGLPINHSKICKHFTTKILHLRNQTSLRIMSQSYQFKLGNGAVM